MIAAYIGKIDGSAWTHTVGNRWKQMVRAIPETSNVAGHCEITSEEKNLGRTY
jgi:hypothetical protein